LLTKTLLPAATSQTPPLHVMNWVSNASAGGVVPAGVVPVPVSGALCGLFGALSTTVSCAERVPASVGLKTTETAHPVPGARVRPEQPSSTTVKSSVSPPPSAALLMKSDAVPVFVTVIVWGGLVVPVSRDAKVSDAGESATAGADGGGEDVEGLQPDSVAVVEVAPSLTVTRQVDEVYDGDSILNEPFEPLVPVTAPGSTVTFAFGSAPLPSTRS